MQHIHIQAVPGSITQACLTKEMKHSDFLENLPRANSKLLRSPDTLSTKRRPSFERTSPHALCAGLSLKLGLNLLAHFALDLIVIGCNLPLVRSHKESGEVAFANLRNIKVHIDDYAMIYGENLQLMLVGLQVSPLAAQGNEHPAVKLAQKSWRKVLHLLTNPSAVLPIWPCRSV